MISPVKILAALLCLSFTGCGEAGLQLFGYSVGDCFYKNEEELMHIRVVYRVLEKGTYNYRIACPRSWAPQIVDEVVLSKHYVNYNTTPVECPK